MKIQVVLLFLLVLTSTTASQRSLKPFRVELVDAPTFAMIMERDKKRKEVMLLQKRHAVDCSKEYAWVRVGRLACRPFRPEVVRFSSFPFLNM